MNPIKHNPISHLLIALIRAYRLTISPIMPTSCRFAPTCSAYGIQAIEIHGPLIGVRLALQRILRCHPWGGSGYDPVPDAPISHALNPRVPNHRHSHS